MKKINNTTRYDHKSFYNSVTWLPRLALGIAFFFHGYGKLPAPFMMDEQHRMVTWFESIFIPMPELWVNLVILGEMAAGIGIILGGVVGFFAKSTWTSINKVIWASCCNYNDLCFIHRSFRLVY